MLLDVRAGVHAVINDQHVLTAKPTPFHFPRARPRPVGRWLQGPPQSTLRPTGSSGTLESAGSSCPVAAGRTRQQCRLGSRG
eukprot:5695123-Lingulodinium_polyedra.AAC.1